ncbi:GGDEF domain-containing protein [Acinetobacter defluvii]|uniref:diguanylate cyclase n=1 Tax=Acinetobacter defluvii TaxID=1871111 RepID=A0A2S2FHY0_9GAMM|nr:GGDEF domain-containing protein [Acinetobacter defluvii]AWL30375.1 GGDEF domain-containing protein [Acinetobacter defluvii]
MSIGAFTGMMTSITGVFTIGSILTGLLIFERHAIFLGSIPCLIVFYAISLLNIFQILPYALIFHPYTMVTEQSQNFMIILNLIISTVVGVTIIRVFYAFLNRWKAREQKQRVLMSLDPLTQILNRRGLSDHYESLQQHAEIQNHPLCVALLDIDYFKKVNDQYGHDAGDQVLQKIAQILKLNLREYDHIGRFGGEEFMIIFTNTSSNMAFSILERCRKSIEHHELAYQGQIIRFTASFGLSCSELYGYDQQTLLQKTDLALYEAKKSGRNCIRMAKEIT